MYRPEHVSIAEPVTEKACRWYAACTRSRHEKVVHRALQNSGIESFLPLRKVLSQWKDRRKLVHKPLFPGYLFLRASRLQLVDVGAVRGLAYFVGNGMEPMPVPDEQVHAIRRLVEGPYPVREWPWLRRGRRVRVKVGPLAGLETLIVDRRSSGKCYLVVTVDLFGRSIAAEIDPRCVEAIC